MQMEGDGAQFGSNPQNMHFGGDGQRAPPPPPMQMLEGGTQFGSNSQNMNFGAEGHGAPLPPQMQMPHGGTQFGSNSQNMNFGVEGQYGEHGLNPQNMNFSAERQASMDQFKPALPFLGNQVEQVPQQPHSMPGAFMAQMGNQGMSMQQPLSESDQIRRAIPAAFKTAAFRSRIT